MSRPKALPVGDLQTIVEALQQRIAALEQQLAAVGQNPAETALIDVLVQSALSKHPFTAAMVLQAATRSRPLRDALDVAGIENEVALGKRFSRLAKGGTVARVAPRAGRRGALWAIRRDDGDAIVTRPQTRRCEFLAIDLRRPDDDEV